MRQSSGCAKDKSSKNKTKTEPRASNVLPGGGGMLRVCAAIPLSQVKVMQVAASAVDSPLQVQDHALELIKPMANSKVPPVTHWPTHSPLSALGRLAALCRQAIEHQQVLVQKCIHWNRLPGGGCRFSFSGDIQNPQLCSLL